jgi:hypothetical protein
MCPSNSISSQTNRLPQPGQRVFISGHSFHIFVKDHLDPMVAAAGIHGHEQVGSQMIGGSSVRQHWDLPDSENQAKSALRSGKVDLLTMSPNWFVPDDAIEWFVELGLAHNPRLRVLVQESWAGWDHTEFIADLEEWKHPEKRVQTNEERDTRPMDILRAATAQFKTVLEAQVGRLNRKFGRDVIQIVPVGDAVLTLREWIIENKVPGIRRQSELFLDPIGHGALPVLTLAAYCNFACMYRLNPMGLDDRNPELDALHPALRPLLQQLAWTTVTAHAMSGVTKVATDTSLPAPRKAIPWPATLMFAL